MTRAAKFGDRALAFRAGSERLAINAGEVSEIIRHPALTRVPLAPASLAGLTNLRGAVIPVVSLRRLLKLEGSDESSGRIIVIGGDSPVGLMVDEVSALIAAEHIATGDAPARMIDVKSLLDPEFGSIAAPTGAGAANRVAAEPKARAATRDHVASEVFFGFEIGGQEFALPLGKVREVLAVPPEIAQVPRTDDAMLGAMSVRNRLLPLLSLPHLLGLVGREGSSRRVVIASIGSSDVGLVVDAVRGILRAAPRDIDPVPEILNRGKQETQIQSICRLDEGRRLVSILSGEHLLKNEPGIALARDEDEEREAVHQARDESEQFVVFQLGGESFGLPIASVAEVMAIPDKLARLPRAPDLIEGVINLRGRIVPVIDQRRRFEIEARTGSRRARVLIVQIGATEAGFIVDDVSEVLRVSQSQIGVAPELAVRHAKVIDRIANFEAKGRMVLLVDPQELLDRAEQDIVAKLQRGKATPA